MGDAQTGAMTDITHNGWMDGMDNTWTCAMTDVVYDGWMDGW